MRSDKRPRQPYSKESLTKTGRVMPMAMIPSPHPNLRLARVSSPAVNHRQRGSYVTPLIAALDDKGEGVRR